MDSVTLKKIAYDKLSSNLDEMLKQYRQMLDIVRKEKDLLLTSNIDQLNENNQAKELIIIKIKSLDASRINYASELAQLVQADAAQPRLLEIAQKMGGEQADRLRNMHAALEMIIKRLSDINQSNSQYADSALRTVNSALENFKDHLSGSKTYQQKGQYKKGVQTSGNFVKREA